MADYKIELGVKLNTKDISTQIGQVEGQIDSIKVNVGAETKDLRKKIKEASKGAEIALKIDTSKIKSSLDNLSKTIVDIRNSLGTLDSKSGMQNLVSSINQMVTALGKAENESDSLVKSLSALSKKDFSVNIGIDLGNSNKSLNPTAYGRKARKQIIPELQSQAKDLEDAIKQSLVKEAETINNAARQIKYPGGKRTTPFKRTAQDLLQFEIDKDTDWQKAFNEIGSSSHVKNMEALETHITKLKALLSSKGVNLDAFNEVHKDATALVNDITGVETAVDKASEVPEKLKNLFGSSVDGEKLSTQLDEIVRDLGEIKTALSGLSQNNAIDGLTQSFNKLSKTLDKLMTNAKLVQDVLGSVGNGANTGMSNQAKNAQETAQAFTEVAQEAKKLDNISIDISNGDIDDLKNALKNLKADDTSIENMINKLNEMNIVAEKVSGTLKNDDLVKLDIKGVQSMEDGLKRVATITETLGKDGWTTSEKFSQSFDKAAESIQKLKKEAETANKIRIDIETEKFENKVSQLHNQLDQLTDVDGSLNNLRASIKQVDDAYDAMTKATDDESLIQAQKRFAAAVEKTNNELKIQAREQRAANNEAKLVDSRTALKTDMLNWLKKNSKAAKEYKAEIDRLIVSLDKLDQAGVNGVRRRFSNIDKEADLKGLKGLNFFDSIKSKIKEYSVYFGAAEMFMYAEQGLRSMFEQVKLIDSAMTELKKVTNETDEAYSNFLTNAATRSREIGTTIDGLVSSTADFARLGYGFEDAQGLAEVANIYAVVGDEIEGVEGATESLISTMAAFKGEMNGMNNTDFAMSIIDKFNEIGNNFAISSGGIGEALERSASSLMAANNTIDESIALITASNQVVQDPAAVGQALKTISMRIRGKIVPIYNENYSLCYAI